MKILLLGGFLGVGKTSVLLRLARHLVGDGAEDGRTKVVIIENEIGEVGVDDKLLASQGFSVRGLFAGCACCTSGVDLLGDMLKIKTELDPEWLIIEPTGVAYPMAIKQSVEDYFKIPVRIIAIADASRWRRLKRAMEGLIRNQLEGASIVLLNKADLADEAQLAEAEKDVREINPNAEIFRTTGNRDIDSAVWHSLETER